MNDPFIVIGTRPEIIKMAPIIKAFQKSRQPFKLLHSGQHFDFNLSLQFIEELGLPIPDYNLRVQEDMPATQTARIMIETEKIIIEEKPELIMVEGDTNTVLGVALAALKNSIPIGHVEAGLRSYDYRMPEEHNRRMVDHISNYLFTPTERARRTLEKENVWGKIYLTGNTVIDAVEQYLPIAQKRSTIMEKINFSKYILATAHRMENVDDLHVLKNFIEAFLKSPIPVIFSIHPRTKKKLQNSNLWERLTSSSNIQLFPPLGYFDFLVLMKNSEAILTDSGGIQEEASSPKIRKPILVMRLTTERPEVIQSGFGKVVGTNTEDILYEIANIIKNGPILPDTSPFGKGDAGEQICEIVVKQILN